MSIGAEPHVNTCYKHFYYFVTEFDLINEKEFAPLQEMTRKICTDIIAPPTPTGQLFCDALKYFLTTKIFYRTTQAPVPSRFRWSLLSSLKADERSEMLLSDVLLTVFCDPQLQEVPHKYDTFNKISIFIILF